VKPVFLLGCYGFIFHGSRNLAQLQNFGGGGGLNPQSSPRYATAANQSAFYSVATGDSFWRGGRGVKGRCVKLITEVNSVQALGMRGV
jgi:hypothetical protein